MCMGIGRSGKFLTFESSSLMYSHPLMPGQKSSEEERALEARAVRAQ